MIKMLDGTLAGSAALLALGLFIASCYEGIALVTGRTPPITDIVNGNISMHPHRSVWITGAICLIVGWLVGHLGR